LKIEEREYIITASKGRLSVFAEDTATAKWAFLCSSTKLKGTVSQMIFEKLFPKVQTVEDLAVEMLNDRLKELNRIC